MKNIFIFSISGVLLAVIGLGVYAYSVNNKYQKLLSEISRDIHLDNRLFAGGLESKFNQMTNQLLCNEAANVGVDRSYDFLSSYGDDINDDLRAARKPHTDLLLKQLKTKLTASEESEYSKLGVEIKVLEANSDGVNIFLAKPFWKSDIDVRDEILRACG